MEPKLEEIKKIILNKIECEAIILFGSYARGTQNSESDIDIAIKPKKELSKKEQFYLSQEIADAINTEVDLVNLDDIGDGFRYEILINGKTIYCEDEFKFELYKLDMYREYLELNESRRLIIDRMKKKMENKAVIINKFDSIERCIKRIKEEYENNPKNLEDYRRMDAIVLNLQRACEVTTDIAMYVISTRRLGTPQTKKEAFELLEQNKLISKQICDNMKKMVGFRNIAIHDYKQIDEDILRDVIENHLNDLTEFAREILNL